MVLIRSVMLGNWPDWDALAKSFESVDREVASLVLPRVSAEDEAAARLVEICWETWAYCDGFACSICCSSVSICANGETVVEVDPAELPMDKLPVLVCPVDE